MMEQYMESFEKHMIDAGWPIERLGNGYHHPDTDNAWYGYKLAMDTRTPEKTARHCDIGGDSRDAEICRQQERIAELEALLEGMKALYMEQRVRAEKAEAEVERLLEALTPCDEAIFDYINALEAQGWTRNKDAEIADAQALLEKVKTALAMTGKEQK